MVATKQALHKAVDKLCAVEPAFAEVVHKAGYPEPRTRSPGYETLLRTIVGQQVSVAAATSIWNKLEARLGAGCSAEAVDKANAEHLRSCGLSAQKQGYAKSLAALTLSGDLCLTSLPSDDEEAIAVLTKVKGIGRWSAEIYLLFAEGRPDVWPAGDLAVQKAVGRILRLDACPSERETRDRAEAWRPHRGAAAILAWHAYNKSAL